MKYISDLTTSLFTTGYCPSSPLVSCPESAPIISISLAELPAVVEELLAGVEELPAGASVGGTRSGVWGVLVSALAGSVAWLSCQAGRAAAVTGGCWGNDRLGRVVL